MSKRASNKSQQPREISMTDLGWSPEGEPAAANTAEQDIYAAGTPGGGTASGGLAGTNQGDGSPENVDLEDALGNGVRDNTGEDRDLPAYGGSSGGAVGGTPARKRASGGERTDRLAP